MATNAVAASAATRNRHAQLGSMIDEVMHIDFFSMARDAQKMKLLSRSILDRLRGRLAVIEAVRYRQFKGCIEESLQQALEDRL